MYELIVAINQTNGIGYKNSIPWKCKRDLQIFKEKTSGHIIVVGRKTCDSLPYLKDRKILCLSKTKESNINWKNNITIIDSLDEIKLYKNNQQKIFICGGSTVYEQALKHKLVYKVHLSIIKNRNICDTYFNNSWLGDFVTLQLEEKGEDFKHYVLERGATSEFQYLNLLKKLVEKGKKREGRNGITYSSFVEHLEFNLQEGFPLLTTKKMFTRGIIEEFLFFLRGDTDTKYLSDKKVRIWEGNTSEEFIKSRNLNYEKGVMGPMYGYQWRFFGAEYKIDKDGKPQKSSGGIDQIEKIVKQIKNDPGSRRILLTSYNPSQAEEGVLYPCHSISIQFYVDGEYLDMFCFNRSQDTFLGVPYNIASSSLLLTVISSLTSKKPRFLKMTMGDTHLYDTHLLQAVMQSRRIPYNFPNLISPDIKNIDQIKELKASDFKIENYKSHPKISAKMVV